MGAMTSWKVCRGVDKRVSDLVPPGWGHTINKVNYKICQSSTRAGTYKVCFGAPVPKHTLWLPWVNAWGIQCTKGTRMYHSME